MFNITVDYNIVQSTSALKVPIDLKYQNKKSFPMLLIFIFLKLGGVDFGFHLQVYVDFLSSFSNRC